ncbi:MAG: hypothetical protein MK100_08970, partial [Phycisphaerales bacterium]|nr:hypothetical protein [Phycisphaerales bacterium]
MRVDHLAYQRATNVAGFGFLIQAGFGSVLLVLGLALNDTASVVASVWTLAALVVWIGLLIVFFQHRLERLESLEADTLQQTAGETALFDESGGVAARRLRMLYRWVLPGLSLIQVVVLGVAGWLILSRLSDAQAMEGVEDFAMTVHRGWMVAVCLSFSVVSFIFSRFLAGMAELDVWRNLRAGAGVMVGNALVFLVVAIGVVFRFFELPGVLVGVTWAIGIFMFAVAIETLLSGILNAYRPRVAGEFPRAAFDSKSLSLLSRPDSFVKSLNEAVNYQFGFDISNSWGYRLILRSGIWLVVLSIVSLLAMSMFVVVDGRQEGLRLRAGRLIESDGHLVRDSGAFWKLPWPFEQSEVFDVSTIRSLPITPSEVGESNYDDWNKLPKLVHKSPDEMFVCRPSALDESNADALLEDLEAAGEDVIVDARWALVRLRFEMAWRVRGGEGVEGGGLLQYLEFGSDQKPGRQTFTNRERILQSIGMAEATATLSSLSLDEVLTSRRGELGTMLAAGIQRRLDEFDAGIEIVSVDVPIVAPPKDAVQSFEDYPVAIQQADRSIADAERRRGTMLTEVVGDVRYVDEVVEAVDGVIDQRRLAEQQEVDAADGSGLSEAIANAEALIRRGGGSAYRLIADAE